MQHRIKKKKKKAFSVKKYRDDNFNFDDVSLLFLWLTK